MAQPRIVLRNSLLDHNGLRPLVVAVIAASQCDAQVEECSHRQLRGVRAVGALDEGQDVRIPSSSDFTCVCVWCGSSTPLTMSSASFIVADTRAAFEVVGTCLHQVMIAIR